MAAGDRTKQSEIIYKTVLITKGLDTSSRGGEDDDPFGAPDDFNFNEPTASGEDSVDLLEEKAFQNLTIQEDMFAPSLSGTISFSDNRDFSSKLPIKGNELLWIEIEEPGGEIKSFPPFHIYSIEEKSGQSISTKSFIGYFVSRDVSVSTYNDTHLYDDREDRLRDNFSNTDDGGAADVFGIADGGFGLPGVEQQPNFPIAGSPDFGSPDFNGGGAQANFGGGEADESEGDIDAPSPEEIEREPEFYGFIDEFVRSLLAQNPEFDQGSKEPLLDRIELTTNKIWYRPQAGASAEIAYPSIKRDGPKKFLTLINQLAENSYDDDRKAANYVFYQDLYKWNFKSIDTMIEEGEEVPPEKIFKLTQEISDESTDDAQGVILDMKFSERADFLSQLKAGAYVGNMTYYRPRVDVNKYPVWYSSDIKRHYYKVNCTLRTNFPAALVGFEQIEEGTAQWRYAFAEVYLVFDYEKRKPSFKIKPIEAGGVRSWLGYEGPTGASGPYWIYKEEPDNADGSPTLDQSSGYVSGPMGGDFGGDDPPQFDYFARPAFNTMEMGNDGYFKYEDDAEEEKQGRVGWEAPGLRIDTELWEEGCFKIQPIRGSMGLAPNDPGPQTAFLGPDDTGDPPLNNITDLNPDRGDVGESFVGMLANVRDHADVSGIYPVVAMNIYYDTEGYAHYFFTAANATDGTCGEVDEDDCKDVREEEE